MSNGGDIFDALVTRITALLPGHRRMPDPYQPEENDDNFLVKSWGLAIGPTVVNTERFTSSVRSQALSFQLKISRQFFAKNHDVTKKAETEKDLLDDMEIFLDDVHKNNLGLTDTVAKVVGCDGVQSVKVERSDFRMITVNIVIEYFRRT